MNLKIELCCLFVCVGFLILITSSETINDRYLSENSPLGDLQLFKNNFKIAKVGYIDRKSLTSSTYNVIFNDGSPKITVNFEREYWSFPKQAIIPQFRVPLISLQGRKSIIKFSENFNTFEVELPHAIQIISNDISYSGPCQSQPENFILPVYSSTELREVILNNYANVRFGIALNGNLSFKCKKNEIAEILF